MLKEFSPSILALEPQGRLTRASPLLLDALTHLFRRIWSVSTTPDNSRTPLFNHDLRINLRYLPTA